MKIQQIKDVCTFYGFKFKKIVVEEKGGKAKAYIEVEVGNGNYFAGLKSRVAIVGTTGVTLNNYNCEIKGEEFVKLSKLYVEVLSTLREIATGVI